MPELKYQHGMNSWRLKFGRKNWGRATENEEIRAYYQPSRTRNTKRNKGICPNSLIEILEPSVFSFNRDGNTPYRNNFDLPSSWSRALLISVTYEYQKHHGWPRRQSHHRGFTFSVGIFVFDDAILCVRLRSIKDIHFFERNPCTHIGNRSIPIIEGSTPTSYSLSELQNWKVSSTYSRVVMMAA